MGSKRAAIILGGLVLNAIFISLLVQVILAGGPPPVPPQAFIGDVMVGGQPAEDGLEIRVKALDVGLNELIPLQLTPDSVDSEGRHLTKSGTRASAPQITL